MLNQTQNVESGNRYVLHKVRQVLQMVGGGGGNLVEYDMFIPNLEYSMYRRKGAEHSKVSSVDIVCGCVEGGEVEFRLGPVLIIQACA